MRGLFDGGKFAFQNRLGQCYSWKEIYRFLRLTLYLRAISKYKLPYIWRGDLTEGFLRYEFGELIFRGAVMWRGLFSEFCGS